MSHVEHHDSIRAQIPFTAPSSTWQASCFTVAAAEATEGAVDDKVMSSGANETWYSRPLLKWPLPGVVLMEWAPASNVCGPECRIRYCVWPSVPGPMSVRSSTRFSLETVPGGPRPCGHRPEFQVRLERLFCSLCHIPYLIDYIVGCIGLRIAVCCWKWPLSPRISHFDHCPNACTFIFCCWIGHYSIGMFWSRTCMVDNSVVYGMHFVRARTDSEISHRSLSLVVSRETVLSSRPLSGV